MHVEETLQELRDALSGLYLAGLRMPRHTSEPGGAGTKHTYALEASSVWDNDKAMKRAAEVLGITDVPDYCCVGAASFDQERADYLADHTRKILRR